jgi:hypothetical protein
MRIFTFFALIISFNSTAHADVYDAVLGEACSAYANVNVADLRDQNTFNPVEQSALICDALKEVSDRYIQTTLKSFEAVFEKNTDFCLSAVISDSINSWEMGTLLKVCYAAFNDGHLQAFMKDSPIVFLPFRLSEIEGRFFISQTGYSVCNDSDFKVGDEVLAIDGEEIHNIKERLKRYVSASTERARDSKAVAFIVDRNFAIPLMGETEILVSKNGVVKTYKKNWRFYINQVSEENKDVLLEMNYKPCEQEVERDHKGYYEYDNLYPESRSKFFYTDLKQTNRILTLSKPKINGRRACYLKLVGFSFSDVYHQSEKVDVWEILEDFVKRCSDKGESFILDLRFNGGGYVHNMISFVQLFASEQSEPFANSTLYSRLSMSGKERVKCYGLHPDVFSENVHAEKFIEAFCRIFQIKARTPEGYMGHLYILSSEECMSSCDYAITFIGSQDNATIIGSPSQGAMLLGSENSWVRSETKPYDFQIFDMAPYYYVGTDESNANSQVLICSDDGGTCLKQFEGAGVIPSESYTATYHDLVSLPAGAGWRDKIESIIIADALKQVP